MKMFPLGNRKIYLLLMPRKQSEYTLAPNRAISTFKSRIDYIKRVHSIGIITGPVVAFVKKFEAIA